MNRWKREKNNTHKKRKKNILCDGHARKSSLIAQLTYGTIFSLFIAILHPLLLINFEF